MAQRLRRLGEICLVVVAILGVAALLGWDFRSWLRELWDVLTQISVGAILAGIVLTTVQTLATGFAWYGILRAAYGDEVRLWHVEACYATAVALNGFVPANLGTLVSLLMFVAVIPSATFSGVLGGYAVEKIFFTVAGAFVYLYLLLSVRSVIDLEFGWIRSHPGATIAITAGLVFLVGAVVRVLRPKLGTFWQNAKDGGRVLAQPRRYLTRVALPSFVGWVSSLGVVAVFLAAYSIPVSFQVIMQVVGGNSIANVVSFTPGGVGVNQAVNVATLNGVTDSTTATAYSVAQQLVTTAWNLVFGVALVAAVFGWSGGKTLVGDSYADAKRQAAATRKHRDPDAADVATAREAG
jgi:uncharacterized membrane protein YbhN (UPF0104 family)